MAIEVDMALGLVFNTQAAVRHLQDGRCQQRYMEAHYA